MGSSTLDRHKYALELFLAYVAIRSGMHQMGKPVNRLRSLRELLICFLYSASASAFSPDVSLIAAGFNESYIRLWNLKGEKLRGMRSDFDPADAKDGTHVPPILTNILMITYSSRSSGETSNLDTKTHR